MLGIEYYADFDRFEEFCRDCLILVDKGNKKIPFVLNSTQLVVLAEIRRLRALGIPPRLVILKARQVGISTLVQALLFWACLTSSNRSALVIAHVQKSSKVLFRMSRNFHRFMRGSMRQKQRIESVHEIEFDSGSRIQVEVQGDPRGYAAQDVHLSEFASYQNPEDTLVAVMQTLPRIVESLGVIESTAQGVGNKFHRLWQRATGLAMDAEIPEDERGWTPIFVPWFKHKEYEMEIGDRFIVTEDEHRLRLEHPEITFAKLKWRRWCIAQGQRVGTDCGIVPIEEVVVGNSTACGAVTSFMDNGFRATVEVTLASGHRVVCTDDHLLARTDGTYIEAGESLGHGIAVQPPRLASKPFHHPAVGEVDAGIARFLGYFAGDGSYNSYTLSVACDARDQDVIEDVTSLVRRFFGEPRTRTTGTKGGCREVRKGCASAVPMLASLGVIERSGRFNNRWREWKRRVCVPECIWRSPAPIVREFLRALFESDGYTAGRVTTFYSKNEPFARDVQLLLLSFGVVADLSCVVKVIRKGSGPGGQYVGWKLNMNAQMARRFDERVGFVSARKIALAGCRPGPTGRKPEDVQLSSKVVRIQDAPACRVFDLTIEREHRFDVGGVLVHNCINANLDGDEDKFAQEYPATPEEAFSLSGRPAFDTKAVKHYTDTLAEIVRSGKLPKRMEIESDPPGIGAPNIVAYDRGRLRIFFEPQDRHTYIVGADPSEGDPGSDHSPLAVLDQMTMDLSATWYGKAPPDVLALHAIDIARYYRDAEIIGESNNHGILFQETLTQNGYPNVFYRKVSAESVSGEITDKPGFLTTPRTREYLFNTLRKYVRVRMGRIHCPHFLQQMQTLVYIEDKAQAQAGAEKDLLIAFALCLMCHRGSMANPLEAIPEQVIRATADMASLLRERDPEGAREYVRIETGMTLDDFMRREDAMLAREARQRKYGLGGLR